MQVTYFLNGPMFKFSFYCHIILYWEKVTSYENFSHSLTLEVQIVLNISAFQCYWCKYWNTEKELNFKKFQLKWKIVKHFTRPEQRAALRKLFNFPPLPILPGNILLRLWNKIFLREIYRNILTFAFKMFRESSSWASGNCAMQMFFLTTNRNMFAEKFVNC